MADRAEVAFDMISGGLVAALEGLALAMLALGVALARGASWAQTWHGVRVGVYVFAAGAVVCAVFGSLRDARWQVLADGLPPSMRVATIREIAADGFRFVLLPAILIVVWGGRGDGRFDLRLAGICFAGSVWLLCLSLWRVRQSATKGERSFRVRETTFRSRYVRVPI